jgi:hypothetical protein
MKRRLQDILIVLFVVLVSCGEKTDTPDKNTQQDSVDTPQKDIARAVNYSWHELSKVNKDEVEYIAAIGDITPVSMTGYLNLSVKGDSIISSLQQFNDRNGFMRVTLLFPKENSTGNVIMKNDVPTIQTRKEYLTTQNFVRVVGRINKVEGRNCFLVVDYIDKQAVE